MTNQAPGIHLQKAVGQTYTIHIPHRYTMGDPVPLILLLHWGGRKYRYIGRDALESLGLPGMIKLEAIIVAPDRKRRHWSTPRAAKDLLKLIEYLEQNYNIHPTKKAITGFSIGGAGVWYMAENHPEQFTCGIAIASPVPKHILDQKWQFPLRLIHSELDEIFPFDLVEKRVARLQENQAPVQLTTVPFASHTDIRDYITALEQTSPWIKEKWENE